jgi:hypothetical protein
VRRIAAVTTLFVFLTLLVGCATEVLGTPRAPDGWGPTAAAAATGCADITGSYVAQGVPAVSNANAGYSFWPVMGSLIAMIERGANGMPYSAASQVRIAMSSDAASFTAFDASDKPQALTVREWWCSQGALQTRAKLGSRQDRESSNVHDESIVRLWRSEDGALIAENTIESVVLNSRRSSARHTPLARFYFRFAPIEPVGEEPAR